MEQPSPDPLPPAVKEPAQKKKKLPARKDLVSHLVLAAPVFLLYHLGLLVSPLAANGADPVTRGMGYLAGLSTLVYLIVMAALICGYVILVRYLSRKKKFNARRFPLVLGEGLLYALVMGPLTNLLLQKVHVLGDAIVRMGPIDRIVASAGAGFYEELIFRLAGIGLIVWLIGTKKLKRWMVVAIAIGITSIIFSAVHYIGPGSDSFEIGSFAFRLVLGGMLALIYIFRGFGTAVYAHFLYDVYVMCFLMA
jgi:CAAX prenyl protease-like protein